MALKNLYLQVMTRGGGRVIQKTMAEMLPILFGNSATRKANLLASACNADGSALVASSQASGAFLSVVTIGTEQYLKGEAAQNNTKTDTLIFEYVVPDFATSAADLTLTVNALYAGTGTIGTKTMDALVYKISDAGLHGADICATTIKTLTNAAADYAFTITGTTLAAGDRLLVKLITVISESGNVNPVYSRINSARMG